MRLFSILTTLALATSLTSALPASTYTRRSNSDGYYNPGANDGSMLTGSNEPMNIIVSGLSSPGVLNQAGFEEFSRSLYFSPGSCLGISQGGYQTANLGDGNGARPQTNIMRYNYNYKQGDGGSCIEALKGGNHFRYWIQNGSSADSGAIFVAASVELNATLNHMIAPNGYNNGRDQIVGNATAGTLTSPGGFQYTVTKQTNQLLSGYQASQINHNIAIDGIVNVLTVTITKNGTIGGGGSSSSSDQSSSDGSSNNGGSVSTPSGALPMSGFGARSLVGVSSVAILVTSGLLVLI